MLTSQISELVASLARLLGTDSVLVELLDDRTRIALPTPAGADYQFVVEVFPGGAAAIVAELRDEGSRDQSWFMEWDPEATASLTVEDVMRHVSRLARNRSRVIRRRGILGWGLTCEVFESGAWSRVGEAIRLLGRGTGGSPNARKVLTFSSPALVAGASDAT